MADGGLYAIYRVLEDQQAARRWTLPFDRLNDEVDRLVIWNVLELPEPEMDRLLDWVASGHVAVIGGPISYALGPEEMEDGDAEGSGMPQTARLLTETGSPDTARSAAAHPVTVGIQAVSVGPGRFARAGAFTPSEDPLFPPTKDGVLVHLVDGSGRPVLLSWPHGQGRIYWSADTEWLANNRIAGAQNLDLALRLLLPPQGKQVAFDEYHHGYQSATTWWQILRGPLRLFTALLAVSVALLFWAYGARFGSPRPTPPGPPRAAVEYVYSMSQIYRRARARQVVLQALYRSLTLELSRLLGGVRGLSHTQIAERTAHRAGVKPEEIARLLDQLDPSQGGTVTDAELIRLARETEELQRRMQHAGYRDPRNPAAGAR